MSCSLLFCFFQFFVHPADRPRVLRPYRVDIDVIQPGDVRETVLVKNMKPDDGFVLLIQLLINFHCQLRRFLPLQHVGNAGLAVLDQAQLRRKFRVGPLKKLLIAADTPEIILDLIGSDLLDPGPQSLGFSQSVELAITLFDRGLGDLLRGVLLPRPAQRKIIDLLMYFDDILV